MLIDVDQSVSLLESGQVVAIPTDTVYGLAAAMTSAAAVEELFALKNRPHNNPLPILAASVEQVLPFVLEAPPGFEALTEAFWPGALTLVVAVNTGKVLSEVRAGLLTVGFRVPDHPLALELLQKAGPLAVTSANVSGRPALVSVSEVEHVFGDHFPIIDGGTCQGAVASTVLCYRDDAWAVTRAGAVTTQQLETVLGYIPEGTL